MARNETLNAIVLAGGFSRRMGEPKALLRIGGVTLLERVVSRIEAVCVSIVVVAQAGLALPRLPNSVRVLRDPLPDAGPLVGMVAGLSAMVVEPSPTDRTPMEEGRREPPCTTSWSFVSAVDAPFVSASVIERLFALRNGYEAVVLRSEGELHPLTAIYENGLATRARELVERGERRARALCESSRTRFVSSADLLADPSVAMDDPELMSFVNVNTRADWDAALERAAALDGRPPKGD